MNKREELKQLLPQKRSKDWYADKLGVTVARVNELLDEINGKEEEQEGVAFEKVEENGDRRVECISPRPMSKEEIEALYGIDGISSVLSTYWNKQTGSGKYLVSALIKCKVADFYSKEELEKRLGDIFPKDIERVSVNRPKEVDPEMAIFLYIADDHCGNDIKNSIYGKTYNGATYQERLNKIIDEVNEFFPVEHLFIVNLGDEVDGWNKQTTRGDHTLQDSLSNKEQFDIYTKGRKEFYDALFTTGVAREYTVINLNNSNHSGNDLSYIVNKSLEFYIQARYPEVEFINIDKFIDVIEWGKHVFAFTHGKDEKLMRSPLPLNLDHKTDLWLFEFFDKLGYSPNDHYTHTIKGDIHKMNINYGKSGRYVNCPSIAGGSSWIELNFGDTRAGAFLEAVEKNSPNITSVPIWFN